jgi:hypothetical protein
MLAVAAPNAFAQAATSGEHSGNMEFVKNLPYELRNGATAIVGTYQEAAALGFAVTTSNGSGRNGTFIAEITDPLHPTTVSFVDITACASWTCPGFPGSRSAAASSSARA